MVLKTTLIGKRPLGGLGGLGGSLGGGVGGPKKVFKKPGGIGASLASKNKEEADKKSEEKEDNESAN